jgi:hypothetical protein
MISAAILAALGLLCVYAFGVRPRLMRWGATNEEVDRPYPGADIVPGAKRGTTMAVTIDAPPSAVWPWLVQMGVDRAIWYTWDYWRPFGRRSAGRIHPEWQDISVGHHMASTLDGSVWWEVAALEPERFLGLRMSVDLRGRPFDPKGTPPHRFALGLPSGRAAGRPYQTGGQRLLGIPAKVAAGHRELPARRAFYLDHADASVRGAQAARRVRGTEAHSRRDAVTRAAGLIA